jgi:STE24 endopeptidase
MGTPAAVPLALLVVAVLQLAAAPLSNAISRRMEAEADWKALEVTKSPAALRPHAEFLVDLAEDPDPPLWTQLMLGTHPTLADRVAMAQEGGPRGPVAARETRPTPTCQVSDTASDTGHV